MLWHILLNEAFPLIEHLARIDLLHLLLIPWHLDGRFEGRWFLDDVVDNTLWIRDIDQIILVFVLDCEFLTAPRLMVDPSQPGHVVFLVCIVEVNPLPLFGIHECIAQQ